MQELELVRIADNKTQTTLGHFLDCGDEWVAYDGADYIGFKKTEYELRKIHPIYEGCENGSL